MSYCSDSPLYIIVTTTYSDIKPPSRSVSLTSRLRNAPYLLASCHTFCLNPRQSSRGLCQVQVVIVFYISLLKPALKGVPLKKKIEINANKDKYNVKEIINLQKGKNIFEYLVK